REQPVFPVQRGAGRARCRRQPPSRRGPRRRKPAPHRTPLSGGRINGARSRRRGEHISSGAQRGRRCGSAVSRGNCAVTNADRKLLMTSVAARTIGGVLALALLTGCGGKKEEESAPVVTVDVAPVLLSKIQRTIRADGLLYPKQQAAIAPKISAPIRRNYVQR